MEGNKFIKIEKIKGGDLRNSKFNMAFN